MVKTPALDLLHKIRLTLIKSWCRKWSIIFCAFVPAPEAKMAICVDDIPVQDKIIAENMV
jgi:hypothetical protein